ncbi:MAG: Hpt domain-containing protein [Oligoflexia bacterium]|nr:Hpt domain-containing protein [Oligoflexia bacterium]
MKIFMKFIMDQVNRLNCYLQDRLGIRLNIMIKIFVRGIPMIIISLSLIELISYKMSSNQIEQLTKEQELTLTSIHAEKLESIISNMKNELISVRNLPSLINFHENITFNLINEAETEKNLIKDFFLKMNEQSGTDTFFRFIYKDGQEKVKVWGKNALTNLEGGINLNEIIPNLKSDISEKIVYKFDIQKESKQHSIILRLPVILSGNLIAVIEISRGLDSILGFLKKEKVFKSGYLAILSAESRIIYHPKFVANDPIEDSDLKGLLDKMIKEKSGNYTSEILGDKFITGFSPLEHYPWYVVAFAPQEEMLEVLTNIKNIVIIIVCASVLLGGLLIYFFMKNVVVAPLNKILDATRQVKLGNLDVQADISSGSGANSAHTYNDEISELGISFNEMIQKLKQYVGEIKEYNKNLEQKINERTTELNEQNKKVSNLLNNMQQSVFTINEDEMVFAPVSKYSEEIFGKAIEGKNIFDLLYRGIDSKSEEYSLIKTALISIFGNNRLQWKLMETNFPAQVSYLCDGHDGIDGSVGEKKEKILHVTYTPIFDQNNELVEQLMFVVDDITEIKNLELKIEKQKAENARNLQILQELSSKEISDVQSFFEGVFKLLDDCQQVASEDVSNNKLQSVFRNIHTIKGNSRILGFNIISQTTHKIESELNLSVTQNQFDNKKQGNIFLGDVKQKIDQIYYQVMEYFNYASKLFRIKNSTYEENLTACHLELLKLETDLNSSHLVNGSENYLSILVSASQRVNVHAKKIGHNDIIQNCNEILMHINENNSTKNQDKKFIAKKYNLMGSKIKNLYLGQLVKIGYMVDIKIWREIFNKVYLITKAFTKEDSQLISKSIEELYKLAETHSLVYLTTISQLQLKELVGNKNEDIFSKKIVFDSIMGYLFNLWNYISLVSLMDTACKLTASKRSLLVNKSESYDDVIISSIINEIDNKNGLGDFFEMYSLVMDVSGEDVYWRFVASPTTNIVPEIIFEKIRENYLGHLPSFATDDDLSSLLIRQIIQVLSKNNEMFAYTINVDLCYLFGQYIEDTLIANCTEKVEVVKNNLQQLGSILENLISERPKDDSMLYLKKQYNKLFETSVKDYLSRYSRMVRDISNNLGKKVKFKVICRDEITMNNEKLNLLCDGITHLIRNSLDHGIELPEERRKLGKNEVGELIVEVKEQNDQFLISVSDDGRGLNKEVIVKKAIDNNLLKEKSIHLYKDEEIVNLIFLPGFTTKSVSNELSGRGVGMDVVKNNIEKLGGELSVVTKNGEGMTVKLLLNR